MKAIICFAIFAVATAIPLKDFEAFRIPDGPVPIPFEMLRNSAAAMPIWRDMPMSNIPHGDVYVAIIPNPNMLMDSFKNLAISGTPVKVVDTFVEVPADIAEEVIPNNEVVGDVVKVVYASEPIIEEVSDDKLEVPALTPEADDLRLVKFVDAPATFDLNNMQVPIDAHDIRI